MAALVLAAPGTCAAQVPRPPKSAAPALTAPMPTGDTAPANDPTPLRDLRHHQWRHRLLLLFTPRTDCPAADAQTSAIIAAAPSLAERDVLVYRINQQGGGGPLHRPERRLTPGESASIARSLRINPAREALVLVGKDGERKLLRPRPARLDEILELIDTMPMRQAEMRRRPDTGTQ